MTPLYHTGVFLTGTESAMVNDAVQRIGYVANKDHCPLSLTHLVLAMALLHGLPDGRYDLVDNEFVSRDHHIATDPDLTPALNAAEFTAAMQHLMGPPAQKRTSRWSLLSKVFALKG